MSSGPPSPVALVGTCPPVSPQLHSADSLDVVDQQMRDKGTDLISENTNNSRNIISLETSFKIGTPNEFSRLTTSFANSPQSQLQGGKVDDPLQQSEKLTNDGEEPLWMLKEVTEIIVRGAHESHEEDDVEESDVDEYVTNDEIDEVDLTPVVQVEEMVDEMINLHHRGESPEYDDTATVTDDEYSTQKKGFNYEKEVLENVYHDPMKRSISISPTSPEVGPYHQIDDAATSSESFRLKSELGLPITIPSLHQSLEKKIEQTEHILPGYQSEAESQHGIAHETDRRQRERYINEPSVVTRDVSPAELINMAVDDIGDLPLGSARDMNVSRTENLQLIETSIKPKPKKKAAVTRKKGMVKTAVKKRRAEPALESDDEENRTSEPAPSPPAVANAMKRRPKKKRTDALGPMTSECGSNGPKYDESGAVLYCVCRKPDSGKWMIGCDGCDEWYHGECINVREEDGDLIDKYYCTHCETPNQETTWRRSCRLLSCRKPARVDAIPPSKYCSPQHGVEFMQLQLARVTVSRNELVAIVSMVNTIDEFKGLGDRIPTPPPEELTSTSPLYIEELARLHEISNERKSLEGRQKLIEKRRNYLPLAIERKKRVLEELKVEGESMSNICGFDDRFALDDEEWVEWCSTPEAKVIFEIKAVPGRDGICIRKRCNRHLRWTDLFADEQNVAERQRVERLLQLKQLEKKIKERQKRRAVKHKSEGMVEVDQSFIKPMN